PCLRIEAVNNACHEDASAVKPYPPIDGSQWSGPRRMPHRCVVEQAAMRFVAGLLLVLAALGGGCRKSPIATPQDAAAACRCASGKPCWPEQEEWKRLGAVLHGKLEQPQAPPASKNPFELQEHAGATQSAGWSGAWNAALSAYA